MQQQGNQATKILADTIANLYKKKIEKEIVNIPVQQDMGKDADLVLKTLAENIGQVYKPPQPQPQP